MKKLLLSFVFLSIFSGRAFSQGGCNPGWATQGFIYPTPDSLPCVVAGLTFSGAFQINMPSMFHGIITLDSLTIDSITGIPSGITWFSYPSPLVIYGDSSACISFIGTTYADSGNYPLTFNCHAVVTSQSAGTQTLSFGQLQQIGDAPIPYYQMLVINYWDTCRPVQYTAIQSVISSSDWNVYPNPGNGNFNVNINAAKGISGQLLVRDMLGQLVYQRRIENGEQYQTSLDLSDFAPGMYMLQLISHSGVASEPKPLVITGVQR